ncbi:SirB2 family protein [Paraferrimonas sp. SM1919]|uniref:SirB2 family protein n=1 Tax=Paraferrimonas sp. SM1919 TaxID=2662263 RepID=UPI0013D48C4F|nr:SirB2 family protein [Paraferrimonas sp. SM1919]
MESLASIYPGLKHLHLTLIAISVVFFLIRFTANLMQSTWIAKKWAKISPHVIDTLMLLSGVVLAYHVAQTGMAMGWLHEKLLAVVAYIVLGIVAMKSKRSNFYRVMMAFGAIGWVLYAAKLAMTKTPILFG